MAPPSNAEAATRSGPFLFGDAWHSARPTTAWCRDEQTLQMQAGMFSLGTRVPASEATSSSARQHGAASEIEAMLADRGWARAAPRE